MRHLLGIRHIRQIATVKGNRIRSGAGIFVVVLYRWASGGTGGNTPSVVLTNKHTCAVRERYPRALRHIVGRLGEVQDRFGQRVLDGRTSMTAARRCGMRVLIRR